MDASEPEWFIAPRDIQLNTTVTLGKLILNPFAPEGPPYLAPALPGTSDLTTESNYPWIKEVMHKRSSMFGIFGSFTANVGIGSELSAQFDREGKSQTDVARLQMMKL